MERGPLSDPRMKEVAEAYVLYCHVGQPKAKGIVDHRDRLGLTGLPSVAFLDADAKVLVRVTTDDRSVDGFLATGRRARRYVSLRSSAATDDEAAAALLVMQMEERQVSLADARRRQDALPRDLPKRLRARVAALVGDLEISAIISAAGRDKEKRRAAGKQLVPLLRGPKHPTDRVTRGFWYVILEHAEAAGDRALFQAALDDFAKALRRTDPGKPWVDNLLERYRKKLDAMPRK